MGVRDFAREKSLTIITTLSYRFGYNYRNLTPCNDFCHYDTKRLAFEESNKILNRTFVG